MKQVIFMCDEELYKQAKLVLPLHGQMSAYLRSAIKFLVEKPEKAIDLIDEVKYDIRGTAEETS